MRVEGTVSADADRLSFAATGTLGDGRAAVRVDGTHRLSDGRGSAMLRLPSTVLGQDGLSPGALSPLFDGLREASGTVTADAHVRWGDGSAPALSGTGAVTFTDVSFTADGTRVEGVDAAIHLDGLFPPSARTPQTLTIRRVDPAVPIDDVQMRFRLDPVSPPRLRLDDARARFAGGALSVAETVLSPAIETQRVRLRLADVDLDRLVDLFKVEGVKASGRISGSLPLVASPGGVAVESGFLAAAGPGVLQVRAEAAASALGGAGEQVALMMSALEDFHYDALSATVDSKRDGTTVAKIRMTGHNPAVLDGYPFAFNIGLSGNLDKILAVVAEGRRLSSDILRPAFQ
jgi:hypothetical protein